MFTSANAYGYQFKNSFGTTLTVNSAITRAIAVYSAVHKSYFFKTRIGFVELSENDAASAHDVADGIIEHMRTIHAYCLPFIEVLINLGLHVHSVDTSPILARLENDNHKLTTLSEDGFWTIREVYMGVVIEGWSENHAAAERQIAHLKAKISRNFSPMLELFMAVDADPVFKPC